MLFKFVQLRALAWLQGITRNQWTGNIHGQTLFLLENSDFFIITKSVKPEYRKKFPKEACNGLAHNLKCA